jgi:hypothetical protein
MEYPLSVRAEELGMSRDIVSGQGKSKKEGRKKLNALFEWRKTLCRRLTAGH